MDPKADFQHLSPPREGDQDRRWVLLAVVGSATLLSTATVILRIYARIKVTRNVGWDDRTIVMAQAISLLGMVFSIEMVIHGVGRHMYYLSMKQIVNAGLYLLVVQILYILATALVKCSACLFLLRIMSRGTSPRLHWFLYVLMAVMIILSITTTIAILFQCTPLAAEWDPRIKGNCRTNPQRLGIGYAQIGRNPTDDFEVTTIFLSMAKLAVAWSIGTDFICALFPILILRKSQMHQRIKYALWAIMGLGVLAGACCVIKLAYLRKLAMGDFTYNGVDINIWGALEQNIGVIAASIPALQPLFKSLVHSSPSPSQSKPGARNNLVLPTWKDSTANTGNLTVHDTRDEASLKHMEHVPFPATKSRGRDLQDDRFVLIYKEVGRRGLTSV